MNDKFTHDEYHFYTTTSGLNKRYVHITEDILDEAAALLDVDDELSVGTDWDFTMRFEVADQVYLTMRPGSSRYPRLESPGYEGWELVEDGKFEEAVWFDSMLFHKCIGKRGRDPETDYTELLEDFVLDQHHDQFMSEFMDYRESVCEKDRNHPVKPPLNELTE
jgi:hypothetical protein